MCPISFELAGKKALVTAAGQGIGRAVAEPLPAKAPRVVATDLDGRARPR